MRGEKAHKQVTIALDFDPGWSRRWRNNFQVNRSFSKYISGCHVCEQVMICFGFICDRLRKWSVFLSQSQKSDMTKPIITTEFLLAL